MLITLGFIALAIGIILVALGYTIEPRAVRPGWAAIVIALLLIFIAAVLPYITNTTTAPRDQYTPAAHTS